MCLLRQRQFCVLLRACYVTSVRQAVSVVCFGVIVFDVSVCILLPGLQLAAWCVANRPTDTNSVRPLKPLESALKPWKSALAYDKQRQVYAGALSVAAGGVG
jgi:hypothetical protein